MDTANYDFPQLIRINKHKANLLNYPDAAGWVADLCKAFIDELTIEQLRGTVAPGDANNALNSLQANFADFFRSLNQEFVFEVDGFVASAEDYYTLCLELLCSGIITKSPGVPNVPSSLSKILTKRYSVGLHAQGRLFDDAEAQWTRMEEHVRERYAVFCAGVQDFTEHKQDDPDLAPAVKARVLLNALKARNERGWLDCKRTGDAIRGDMDVDPDVNSYLSFDPSILMKAKELFGEYPYLAVRPLMELLDYCVDIYLEDFQEKGFNPVWHAKRGKHVPFFLSNIAEIAKEIDQARQTHFLSHFQ